MSIRSSVASGLKRAAVYTGFDQWIAELAQARPHLKVYVPQPHYYPANTIRSCTRDGAAFALYPADYMQWALFAGISDMSVHCAREAIERNRGPCTVLDVGANCGHFSLKLASLVSADLRQNATVYAFEPNPVVASLFLKNLSLNEKLWGTVNCIQAAVGSENSTLSLEVPSRNSGAGSLARKYEHESFSRFQVPVVSVDAFLEGSSVEGRVAFIKADVEGFEPEVLIGASRTIETHRPDFFLEVGKQSLWQGRSAEEFIFSFLREREYRLFSECSEGETLFLVECDSLAELPKVGLYNLLAKSQ